MRSKIANFTYVLLSNLIVAFLLNFSVQFLFSQYVDWNNLLLNFSVAFLVGVIIGSSLPLVKIGKWFTKIFKVENETYTNNILYRLLATLIINSIFFIFINPTITIVNFIVYNQDHLIAFLNWLWTAPYVFIVGYCASLIGDFIAYRCAHKIDNNF